ncbi:MAG: hypothetical protein CVU54_01880 [Deltaproteobacteria bacterium HGW-Deltaproteobacteria-12]|jgi:phage gp37-like protein|nr:MAG: hypothetical protein CVU54_01880 [Deltaproteobacteria bacterium HGW-Deltaproteobacteria-12]
MIETIQDDIIAQLAKISGIKSVGTWQGDIDDLLKSPQLLPALAIIYQGADFEKRAVIGINKADLQMSFLIVLVSRNFRSREAGASSAYTIIEASRNYLIGHKIAAYGYLWPVKEELLSAEGGFLVYGLSYRISTDIIATEPLPAG